MKLAANQDVLGYTKSRRRFPVSHFVSNFCFVVGSVLYLVLAVEDHGWGKKLQELPVWLRTADDDIVWMNYRLEERHNASLEAGAAQGRNHNAVGQTRRLQFEMYQNFGILAGNAETSPPIDNYTREEVRGNTTITTVTTTSESQTPDQLYQDNRWEDLPPEIQDAYSVLGYNATIWDGGAESSLAKLWWDHLTPEQQQAALFVGYRREEWDEDVAFLALNQTLMEQDLDGGSYSNPNTTNSELYSTNNVTINELEGIGSEVENELEDQTILLPHVTDAELHIDDDDSTMPLVDTTLPDSNIIHNLTAALNTTNHESLNDLSPSDLNLTGPALDTTAQYLVTTVPTIKPTSAPSTVLPTTDPLQPTDPPLAVSPPEDETPDGGAGSNYQPASAPAPSPNPTPAPAAAVIAVTPAPGPTPEELYGDEWWNDLPPDIQAAYSVLGYTELIWNSDEDARTENLWWDELAPEQQEAALFIGYTKGMWDGEANLAPTLLPTAQPSSRTVVLDPSDNATNTSITTDASEDDNDVQAIAPEESQDDLTPIPESVDPGYYEDYWWADLPPEIQAAASELGYNQGVWDSGGLCYTEELYWDKLSPSQQQAAALLGYDQYSWDEVDPLTGDGYVSYDDDYVFRVAATGTWVSRYMILYFLAALCFVFVGVLDLICEKYAFHVLMIIAGLTGVASAMLVEKDAHISNILDCISVQFFLLEATTLFGTHRRAAISTTNTTPKWAMMALVFADSNFILGSLMDVILSYLYLFDETADWDMTLAVVGILAACMWLVCSLIYLWVFFYEYKNSAHHQDSGKKEEDANDEDEEESIPAKVQFRLQENKPEHTKTSLESSEDNPTRKWSKDIDC